MEHVKPGWMEAMEAREHECGMISISLYPVSDLAPRIQLSDIDLRSGSIAIGGSKAILFFSTLDGLNVRRL